MAKASGPKKAASRGGFAIGLVAGLLIGLASGAGGGAVHHQGARPLRRQAAAAHRRTGQGRGRAQPPLGPEQGAWRRQARAAARGQRPRGPASAASAPMPGALGTGCRSAPSSKDPAAILSGGSGKSASCTERHTDQPCRTGRETPLSTWSRSGAFTRGPTTLKQQRARLGLQGLTRQGAPSASRPAVPSTGCGSDPFAGASDEADRAAGPPAGFRASNRQLVRVEKP
jgi:hypothetical protein